MSLILRKIPSTWYRYDVQFAIELLQAYIDGAEQQALDSIETFRREKTTHVFEEAPEEGSGRIVETHKGLDDETWDLNTVFETYFPNLQRRSTLITVYSFLEHELGRTL
jgi:hypothetical protein